jgi:dipeptidyl aminopeptidase/acylaminoacyl peptidase
MEQGVLYKPEDFDPNRKYPVILHYYSRKSQEANTFHAPGRENGHLDIAWFVSRGYLVFTPDIHYKIGELGQSAVNSVVGAAKHLSQFSWVDAKKMGLQGHSLGGYETNYIITQTNLFAAACSSSGLSDIISNYLGFLGLHTNHDWYENRICRIGATLWEKPDLYIKNSPVFQLDKVTTPLLTVANKNDLNVSFDQGVALFTALRRLGKKVWMLQYDEGDHGVDGKSRIDYTLRMTQFFDHYLKGAPAPRWMTRGIPAKLKGIDNGLTLDAAGIEPPAALLIKK